MMQMPPGWKPRRVPHRIPSYNVSSEEKARLAVEKKERYQRCRTIFERVRDELIDNYYNWYITIDANSGNYFIEQDYMAIFQKLKSKQIAGKFVTFRLNETGTCGTI
ncbi:MAG TPA: hypothetical protein DCY91_00630 [Cyanobacteria bacterium UBA11370]|nr:hypothetical protein [Cyanobacteria bacterium UBA11370]HBY79458.1 hypothetical protein [Cyanobacteria bacterium UBA11148]